MPKPIMLIHIPTQIIRKKSEWQKIFWTCRREHRLSDYFLIFDNDLLDTSLDSLQFDKYLSIIDYKTVRQLEDGKWVLK